MNSKSIEALYSLKGKVAVIIGGAGLLGPSHAEILSDAGANVVIVDLNYNSCSELADRITKRNNIKSIAVESDITSKDSIIKMKEKIIGSLGKIDIIINNAVARPMHSIFEDYPIEYWRNAMAVNLDGIFLCSQILGKEMIAQGSGVILNIGSTYGLVSPDIRMYDSPAGASPAVYAASKGGIIQLTKYLATYWSKKGIRVNCLSPGGVLNDQDPKFVQKYSERVPLGRMANKDEFKGVVLFMVSDASTYLTGANIVVDGGWTCW